MIRLVAIVVIATHAAPAGADPCSTPAECHLVAGQALMARGDFEGAAKRFRAAFDADPTAEAMADYATALERGHHEALAYDAFVTAAALIPGARDKAAAQLRQASATGDATAQQQARDAVDRVEPLRLAIESNVSRLKAIVGFAELKYASGASPDGIVVARADGGDVPDPFAHPIAVHAGHDTLVVTYGTGETHELAIDVGAGETRTVVVEPATPPARPSTPAATTTTTLVSPPPEHRSRAGLVLAAGAVAALGVAGGFAIQSARDWNEAEADGCTDAGCTTKLGQQHGDRSNTLADVARYTAIGGGVLAAASAYLLLHHESPTAAVVVTPSGTAQIAAVVTGTF